MNNKSRNWIEKYFKIVVVVVEIITISFMRYKELEFLKFARVKLENYVTKMFVVRNCTKHNLSRIKNSDYKG